LSIKKIFISTPVITHTINKINITIYVYNKEKMYLLKKLQILNSIFLGKKTYRNIFNRFINLNYIFKYIKNRSLSDVNTLNSLIIKNNKKKKDLFFHINSVKHYNNNNIIGYNSNIYIISIFNNLLRNKIKHLFLYKYYISLLFLNNYKFNVINMVNLKNILVNIYNKQVSLNIVNLKYIYLNNDIFINIITRKINDRKKRILKIIRNSFSLINKPSIHPLLLIK
jgi:hypothetical protein